MLSIGLAAPSAYAANYVLDLSGSASDVTTDSFMFGGVTYQTGLLQLSGFTPFTLQDGDTVDVTVDITSGPLLPFVVPTRDQMFFGLNFSDLLGGSEPLDATADGTMSFDGGPPVGVGCGNCTSLIHGQNNAPLSFSHLVATGAFALGADYEVNSISISYQVNGDDTAVPEPASWALMTLGVGGVGWVLRRRRGQDGFALA
ncbi:MAG TPA: PEP-CTERM sorting domain-containing protein [Phenylobacterium sp.]|nr:PEP-CTERM sorting domain-containing protein [Phenylobacterium sp.]